MRQDGGAIVIYMYFFFFDELVQLSYGSMEQLSDNFGRREKKNVSVLKHDRKIGL